MWNPFKLFITKTSYPEQVIPPKALELVNRLDNFLTDTSEAIGDSKFSILSLELGLIDQMKSTDSIMKFFQSNISPSYAYIPRSIAFICNQDGTWVFFIGVRRETSHTPKIAVEMFMDLLNRTNGARV